MGKHFTSFIMITKIALEKSSLMGYLQDYEDAISI